MGSASIVGVVRVKSRLFESVYGGGSGCRSCGCNRESFGDCIGDNYGRCGGCGCCGCTSGRCGGCGCCGCISERCGGCGGICDVCGGVSCDG